MNFHNPWTRVVVLTALVAAGLTNTASAGDPSTNVLRLALISETGLEREADGLLLELQKQGVELVERDVIGRILREQSLQTGQLTRDNAMRVGRLLKADGLAFLQFDQQAKPPVVCVRLVAVGPGAIVWSERFATNGVAASDGAVARPDPQAWARDIGSHLVPLLPKLRTPREQVRPVSLVRVTVRRGGQNSADLENELNALLVLRLAREPDVFVLERENLARLDEERHWAGATSEFWTGGHLLDGGIEQDLVKPDELTVVLRLRPAPGAAGSREVILKETGSRAGLAALVERLAKAVCSALAVKTTATAWEPVREGREYFRWGRWLADPARRKAAVNTAWTLGCREVDVAEARLAVLREEANVVASAPADLRYKLQDPYRAVGEGKTWLREHPEILRACAERLIEALAFHRTYAPPGQTHDGLGASWKEELATALLRDACRFLGLASESGRAAGLRDEIAAVQRECQQLAGALWQDPTGFEWQELTLPRARFFLASAEEILKVYRRVLAAPRSPRRAAAAHKYSYLRSALLDRKLIDPVFEPVSETEQARRDALWSGFIEEVANSKTPENVLAVLALSFEATKTPAEREAARAKIQEAVWQWRDLMPTHQLGWGYLEIALPAAWSRVNMDYALKLLLYFTKHPNVSGYDYGQHCYRYLKHYAEQKAFNEDQARQLYEAMLARQKRSPREEIWALNDFAAAYPSLLATSRIPLLHVTSCLQPPSGSTGKFHLNDFLWRDGRLWFYTGRDIVGLDPKTRQFESIAVHAEIREHKFKTSRNPSQPLSQPAREQVTLTDSHVALFQYGQDHQLGEIKGDFVGRVSVCSRRGGDWRSHDLAFAVKELTPVGDALYGLYVAPTTSPAGEGQEIGLVRIAPDSLAITMFRPAAPGQLPSAQQSPSGLTALTRLRQATTNELWLSDPRGGHWAYDLAQPGWRAVKPDEWCRLPWFILTVRGNGPALPATGWVPTAFTAGNLDTEFRPKLLVTNAANRQTRVLRLEFHGAGLTYNGRDDYRSRFTYAFPGSGWNGFIPTETGVLIPSNLLGGSLWFVPYDEIAATLNVGREAATAKESGSTVVP